MHGVNRGQRKLPGKGLPQGWAYPGGVFYNTLRMHLRIVIYFQPWLHPAGTGG